MKPNNCRVLLTGASGGIGSACARRLIQAGASVMLCGRSPARLAAQARALVRDQSVERQRVEWYACDLTRTDSLAPLVRSAALWGCNVVVHGAGVPAFGRLEALSTDAIDQVIALNLVTPMRLTQAMLPHLRQQSQASMVFIGSVLGRLALPGYSVYSASKFGLRGFAESLRRELADGPVGVQYLGPRSTRTAFNSEAAQHHSRATGASVDDVDTVAEALLRLLESGEAERFLGFPEAWAVRLNGLAPNLLDGTFANHRRHLGPAPAPSRLGPAVDAANNDPADVSHSLLAREL
jgi:short-subunit dehydrogenase